MIPRFSLHSRRLEVLNERKKEQGAQGRHPDSTGIFFKALEDLVHFWVIYKTTVNKNAIVMVLHSHKLQSVEPFQSRGWKNMFTITRFC